MKKKNRNIKFLIIIFLFIAGLLFVSRVSNIPFVGIESKEFGEWSIGIYTVTADGMSLKLSPHKRVKNPVLTAKDITDRKAYFVADPFLIYEDGIYYMFFEVLTSVNGDIGLAISEDAINWNYNGIVLDKPFHLSYPCVVKWKKEYYMIPESHQACAIQLYKAVEFPKEWIFIDTLIEGMHYVDPTIFRYNDKWWIFSSNRDSDILYLYYSDNLTGPYIEHPKSPVVIKDAHIARPGGNIIYLKGKLIRIAQDDYSSYGNAIRAFEIIKLSPEEYKEREIKGSLLLKSSGVGWNRDGVHQLSSVQIRDNKQWIAAVDGKRTKKKYYFYIRLPQVVFNFLEHLVD